MSSPGLVSKLTVAGLDFNIQTESDSQCICTTVFCSGESRFSMRTPYEPSTNLMTLIRLSQKQHQTVHTRCAQGEFCSPKTG